MIFEKIQEKFPAEILGTHQDKGDETIIIRKERCHDILRFLKEATDLGFDFLMDLCGVDYLAQNQKPRFEVVYHLYSLHHNHRLRLRVKIDEKDMTLPTASDLWKTADWFERETAEFFGFTFIGHPNPKHLLLFEGFQGHPLRKDFKIEKRQKIPVPEEKVT